MSLLIFFKDYQLKIPRDNISSVTYDGVRQESLLCILIQYYRAILYTQFIFVWNLKIPTFYYKPWKVVLFHVIIISTTYLI